MAIKTFWNIKACFNMETDSTVCFKLLISSIVGDVFQATALSGLILLAHLLKHLLNMI